MSALHELLEHLGNDKRFDNRDYHRAMMALLDRLDLVQPLTIATQRTRFGGHIVDAAIAPDGRVWIVERDDSNHPQSQLYAWSAMPLRKPETITVADHIRLHGFTDSKTLVWESYRIEDGLRLHMGDWISNPVLKSGLVDTRVLKNGKDEICILVSRELVGTYDSLYIFRPPLTSAILEVHCPTREHRVVNGEFSWIEQVSDPVVGKREYIRWGEFSSDLYPWGRLSHFTICPKTGKPRWVRDLNSGAILESEGGESSKLNGRPKVSEGYVFDVWTEALSTPQGERSWIFFVGSCDLGWSWRRRNVKNIKAIIAGLPEDKTVLLVDPNTKRDTGSLDVVVLDRDGSEHTVRINDANGRILRLGDVIVVETCENRESTVTLLNVDESIPICRPFPLVGRLDRLTVLEDGTIVGWHYANGVFSLQRYPR